MSRYGVPMLKKLKFQYCDWGGSSRGMREFLEHVLPRFQEVNPHVEVEVKVKRNQHPYVEGTFANRASRPIGVKNLPLTAIEEHVKWLRTTHGRTVQRRVPAKHIVSKRPSIQGTWTPDTFSLLQRVGFQAQQAEAAAAAAAAAPGAAAAASAAERQAATGLQQGPEQS